jgi:uncharacterized MAPEG superfamily protein
MTFAFWCVLAAAYMPIVWTGLAKFGGGGRDFDNARPREYLEATTGWRRRAHWAQLNGFEAFPPFAAAVLIAHFTMAPQGRVDALAGAFIGLRILYGVLYLADRPSLRSLAWLAATACVVGLFIVSAIGR